MTINKLKRLLRKHRRQSNRPVKHNPTFKKHNPRLELEDDTK